jgi:hypothetical protein
MSRSASLARARRQGTGFGLAAGLFALAAIGVGALGYVAVLLLWPAWPGAADGVAAPPSLPITVGGVVFNVPPAAIRNPALRVPGAQARLDMAFQWPDFAPPPAGTKPQLSDELKPNYLFVTVTGPQGRLPLMERIRTIYPRYIESTAFSGPDGLTGVAFRDGTPYQGEDLMIDAEHPERFTARCTRPSGPMTGACLLERRVGEAEVTLRFPREWLAEWRTVLERADALLARLSRAQPRR